MVRQSNPSGSDKQDGGSGDPAPPVAGLECGAGWVLYGLIDGLVARLNGTGQPMNDDHSTSFIDPEGVERCSTCDKWLEPGYYTIEDHCRAEARKAADE